MFDAAHAKTAKVKGATFIPNSSTYWAYGTLAFGSALALFMYPHSVTAVLAGRRRNVIRRNAAILPTYSLMLGMLALLGFAAIYKKTSVIGQDGKPNAQLVVPHFFDQVFPSWFAGVAFAAIAIGALVPAAIMSIAAANLFTRNIYREFLVRDASPAHEARVSKITSLVVKFGALMFVLGMDRQNAINLQLLGGVWILQTILSIVAGLYTRWLHRWALLVGWAVAMAYGTVVAYHQSSATTKHFGSSLAEFPGTHTKVYIAVTALLLNVVVSVVLTIALRLAKAPAGADDTEPADYYSDSRRGRGGRAAEDLPADVRCGYSARYSRWDVSSDTSLIRTRIRVCRLSGARSLPQQRAISERTSCSRPYCLRQGAQASRCWRMRLRSVRRTRRPGTGTGP